MTQFNYEVDENIELNSFDPLPSGKYNVKIVNAEIRETKTGNGKMLSLIFEVLPGSYENRKLFKNLCLEHPNELTVNIAKSNLNKILLSISKRKLNDTQELIDKKLTITVNVKEGINGLENQITKYEPLINSNIQTSISHEVPQHHHNEPFVNENKEFKQEFDKDVPF